MRKPVVAPRLDPLVGLPGLMLSTDREEFVANVARARGIEIDQASASSFVRTNSWEARVTALIDVASRTKRLGLGPR